MGNTGRWGFVQVDRHWLENPDLGPVALVLMMWLTSHNETYLASVHMSSAAEQLGWSRNRVIRATETLEQLGLITTTQIKRRGGGTVTKFALHIDEWAPSALAAASANEPSGVSKRNSAVYRNETRAVYRNETPSTSTSNIGEHLGVSCSASTRRLCETFADLIEQSGAKRPNVTQQWLTDMDRLQRLDGRTDKHIELVLRWLAAGRDDVASFWWPNIRSPAKLRAKWDQMAAQHNRNQNRGRPGGHSVMDRIRRATGGHTP